MQNKKTTKRKELKENNLPGEEDQMLISKKRKKTEKTELNKEKISNVILSPESTNILPSEPPSELSTLTNKKKARAKKEKKEKIVKPKKIREPKVRKSNMSNNLEKSTLINNDKNDYLSNYSPYDGKIASKLNYYSITFKTNFN